MKNYRLITWLLSGVLLASTVFQLPAVASADPAADSSSAVAPIMYEDILTQPSLQADLKQYLSAYRELVEPDMLDAYDDYVIYLTTTLKHRKYEALANTAYQKYRVDSVKTRVQSYNGMTHSVIPNYKKFVSLMKTVNPADSKLNKLHQNLLKGISLQLEGFQLLQKYFSKAKRDDLLFYKANNKLKSGKKWIDQYNTELFNYVAQF
ncbi:hypothetical protein [Paenibacillus wulumuqiensis]|uniref:hypothetical protein n=1 Tax=Paenibacillus wulumuqiensis TaxID=1567107 RepID=UPI000619C6A5|nr:hypothetical protein [Paenibacillus wulumuqiensis]